MSLTVRTARLEDASGIVDVLNPIIEAGVFTVLDQPLTEAAQQEFISRFPERGIFLVAVENQDDKIVGLQSMEPFASYTRAFDHVGVIGTFVDLTRRRRGTATRLFHATFDRAREKGYEKLHTFIRGDNPAALAAYMRHGFRIVGTAQRQAKLRGNYIDEIIVERFL